MWLLGLEGSTWARVIIGTAYDPRDFVAYASGALLIAGVESVLAAKGARRLQRDPP